MSSIPKSDSVAELARFWDSHDLTDLEDELEEVTEPVFARRTESMLRVALAPDEAEALHRAAMRRGMAETDLVREWVRERLHPG